MLGQTIERRGKTEAASAIDWARWGRSVAFGGVFYPAVAHWHYNFLEWLVVVKWATPASRIRATRRPYGAT